MPNAKKETKKVILGSGDLYLAEVADVAPTVDDVCKEENRFGYVKGGATLTYSPDYTDVEDDMGYIKRSILSKESASLKSGVMTISADTLNKLVETGRVSEDKDKGRRTIRIGGMKNASGKNYAVCFHHPDKAEGDSWVLIVGRNKAGFELAFATDDATVVDAEFTCEPMDSDGTLIAFVEEDETLKSAADQQG